MMLGSTRPGGSRGRWSKLRMFARLNNFGEQALLLQLHVVLPEPATLFLPLPVKAGGRCAFIDVGGAEQVFPEMDACWEPSFVLSESPGLAARLDDDSMLDLLPARGAAFHASRTELARHGGEALGRVPAVADCGFAAFHLDAGDYDTRPMALVFQSREPEKIFFPLHDVTAAGVPEKVERDHHLYLQTWTGKGIEGWFASDSRAQMHVNVAATQRLVKGELFLHRTHLKGTRKNEDVWVRA